MLQLWHAAYSAFRSAIKGLDDFRQSLAEPFVLIDEIENAGIDCKKAFGLLMKKGKVLLLAIHDPILALLAEKRLIIRNGGIVRIIETSQTEKALLTELEIFDNRMLNLRERLRAGECIDEILRK